MRKLILMLTIFAIAGVSYGQKKPKINQAENAREDGNLGEAKEIIDEAIVHEKTMEDGKTWYYRGLIYASLDTTSNPEYQNLADNPLQTAMESFAKADELNSGSSEYYITNSMGLPVTKGQQINTLWAHYLNKGVESYQNQDLKGAAHNFEQTTIIQPDDTTGYIYAASAAQSMEEYDRAAKHYYTLLDELDYANPDVYNALIYIEQQVNKDNDKALELLRRAKVEFPEDNRFAKTEINILIQEGKADEARAELERAIAAEPDNPDLYFSLGVMNEELGDTEGAMNAYQKAIDADPSYFNGNFNLAVLKYNEAVNLLRERNNLGISGDDQKKARAMDIQIKEKLEEALPAWERVNELQPNDRKTIETLEYIYLQLRMNDKADEMAKKLESMPE